MTVFDPL